MRPRGDVPVPHAVLGGLEGQAQPFAAGHQVAPRLHVGGDVAEHGQHAVALAVADRRALGQGVGEAAVAAAQAQLPRQHPVAARSQLPQVLAQPVAVVGVDQGGEGLATEGGHVGGAEELQGAAVGEQGPAGRMHDHAVGGGLDQGAVVGLADGQVPPHLQRPPGLPAPGGAGQAHEGDGQQAHVELMGIGTQQLVHQTARAEDPGVEHGVQDPEQRRRQGGQHDDAANGQHPRTSFGRRNGGCRRPAAAGRGRRLQRHPNLLSLKGQQRSANCAAA